jgi:ABC-2 type transport system permease protein
VLTKVLGIALQSTFVYRWNFLLRLIFGVVPLVGMVALWQEIFAGKGAPISGYGYSEVVLYFLITTVVYNLVTPTEDEWQIAAEIREGRMSALLLKPLNYLHYRFMLYLGYRIVYVIVTVVPCALLLVFFREHLALPANPATWLWFLLSTAMAAALQFLIAYTLAMLAFWILEISTIVFIVYSFEYFLSGQIFPLDLMPEAMQRVMKWLPFMYELFFPVQIYMERVQGAALAEGLCIQAAWVCVAYGCAVGMYRRGVRHYQAFGG